MVLVAIDGRGGAGKSSFAARLATALNAVVVPGDDFYRVMDENERKALGPEEGYRHNFDWERLRSEVLQPLRDGTSARYRRFDWSIVVQAPRSVCSERMRARGENDDFWIDRWVASEDWYFANVLSEKDVDMLVDGTR